jgi:hypothetical protein
MLKGNEVSRACSMLGEMRNAHRILVRKPEGRMESRVKSLSKNLICRMHTASFHSINLYIPPT